MRNLLLLLTAGLAGLASSSCARNGATAAAEPASNVFIAVAGPGEGQRPPAGFEGLWIDILPGVEYRQTLVMGSGGPEQEETRLNGHRLVVEQDYIVIGPERYGPLAAGTHVEIKSDGVFAGGKRLGRCPSACPSRPRTSSRPWLAQCEGPPAAPPPAQGKDRGGIAGHQPSGPAWDHGLPWSSLTARRLRIPATSPPARTAASPGSSTRWPPR